MQLRMKELGYFLFVCILLPPISALQDLKDTHDLCAALRNKYIYVIEENNSLHLVLHSSAVNDKLMLQKLKKRCTVIIKVCPACHISVGINNMNIPSCSGNCSCNGFQITEPLSGYNSKIYCGIQKGPTIYYESGTKTINIDFVQSVHKEFYVSLTFNVSRNIFIFTEDLSHSPKYIETPYFPLEYPPDYGAEYIFQARYPMGIVQLLFIDFQICKGSAVEIFGHNGTHTAVFNGDGGRPPALTSQNTTLKVSFRANDCPSNKGFRIEYVFGQSCGSENQGLGGVISLNTSSEDLFDCVWIIYPPLFAPKSILLSVYVLNFSGMGINSTLEIRKGLTSMSNLVKVYKCENLTNCSSKIGSSEVVIPVDAGVYVRFHGYINKTSLVNLSYFIFHEENCSNDEYYCKSRCIKYILLCNGYSNCPDEIATKNCSDHVSTAVELNNSTNEILVKSDRSSNEMHGFIIFFNIIGVIGITLSLLVVVAICYTRKNYRESEDHQIGRSEIIYVETENEPQLPQQRSATLHILYDEFCQNNDMPPLYNDVLAFSDRYPPVTYLYGHRSAATFCLHKVIPTYPWAMTIKNEGSALPLPVLHNNVDFSTHSNSMKSTSNCLSRSFSLEWKKNELVEDFTVTIKHYSSLPYKLDIDTKE